MRLALPIVLWHLFSACCTRLDLFPEGETASNTFWSIRSVGWEVQIPVKEGQPGPQIASYIDLTLHDSLDFYESGCQSVMHTSIWRIECATEIEITNTDEFIPLLGAFVDGIWFFDAFDAHPLLNTSPSPTPPSPRQISPAPPPAPPPTTPPPPPRGMSEPSPEIRPTPVTQPPEPSPATGAPARPSPSTDSPSPATDSPSPATDSPSPAEVTEPFASPDPASARSDLRDTTIVVTDSDVIDTVRKVEVNGLLIYLDITLFDDNKVWVEYYAKVPDMSPHVPQLRSLTSSSGDEHQIYLYRLYEDVLYEYNIYVFDSGDRIDEPEFTSTFRSGRPDSSVRKKQPTVRHGTPTYDLTYSARDRPGVHFIFDNEGRVVWNLDGEKYLGFPGEGLLRRPDNQTVYVPEIDVFVGLMVISPSGIPTNFINTDCLLAHHDTSLQDDDVDLRYIWGIATQKQEIEDMRHEQAVDTIVKFDLQSETYNIEIDFLDYLDIYDDRSEQYSNEPSDSGRFFPCYLNETVNNWLHINSLHVLNDSFLLAGSHHLESIFCFERESSHHDWELSWRLGHDQKSDFTFLDDRDTFYGQHDVVLLPNENLLLFDNGVGRPGGWFSRGIELEIDFERKNVRSVWEFRLRVSDWVDIDEWDAPNEEFVEDCEDEELEYCTSGNRGTLKRLDNGNTIIVFQGCNCDPSERGYTVEVDSDGEMVSLVTQDKGGWMTQNSMFIDSVGGEQIIL